MNIKTVGVAGTGAMGRGISQACIQSGYHTVLRGRTQESVTGALERIRRSLGRQVERGRMTEEQGSAAAALLQGATGLEDLAQCDLVIDCIIEDSQEKRALFAALDRVCPQPTIFASTTSAIPIIEIAMATSRPDRVAGMHFFDPAYITRVVEVIEALSTSRHTLETARAFAESLGKTVILAKDTPGFVLNRIWIPFVYEAIRTLELGLATKEEIDNGVAQAFQHTWGPLTMADAAGLDTMYQVGNTIYQESKDPKFAPPVLLKRMVLAGRLGRKAGRGFFDYK